MNTSNKALLELMQSIEVRKQTEHRLKATMSVLLARSENQILVLETLLKRLVQVCVHTQDKRLAKELKLMDFTRLAKKIGDDHTQMRQMIMQEDGMLTSSSPAEHFLMDSMGGNGASGHPGGVSGPSQMMDDPQGLSGGPGGIGLGANAVNLSQFRSPSSVSGAHMSVQQHMMPSPHHPGNGGPQQLGPQGQHMQQPMRREGSSAVSTGGRDPSLHLRQLWPDSSGHMENPMMNSMNMGGGMHGTHGPSTGSMMGGGGSARMRMAQQMTRSPSAAGSQLTAQPSANSGGPMRGFPEPDAFSGFS